MLNRHQAGPAIAPLLIGLREPVGHGIAPDFGTLSMACEQTDIVFLEQLGFLLHEEIDSRQETGLALGLRSGRVQRLQPAGFLRRKSLGSERTANRCKIDVRGACYGPVDDLVHVYSEHHLPRRFQLFEWRLGRR